MTEEEQAALAKAQARQAQPTARFGSAQRELIHVAAKGGRYCQRCDADLVFYRQGPLPLPWPTGTRVVVTAGEFPDAWRTIRAATCQPAAEEASA